MTRQLFVLVLMAKLVFADVFLQPVLTGESGEQYIEFEDKKYPLQDGSNSTVTFQSGDCIVTLDLSLKTDSEYKDHRQGSRICKHTMNEITDKASQCYVKKQLEKKRKTDRVV
ncbi:unnamed protein product [Dibothriocephalus latus]|uniref:Secreted protein n=1 Tax=Dibothriocephalus latus TaxID=60516 RepID=A0A3P6PSR4_DIBLA|nr:unnamed protein product [Dibothriocephalus latus]